MMRITRAGSAEIKGKFGRRACDEERRIMRMKNSSTSNRRQSGSLLTG